MLLAVGIADMKRFRSAKKLATYAGLDQAVSTSSIRRFHWPLIYAIQLLLSVVSPVYGVASCLLNCPQVQITSPYEFSCTNAVRCIPTNFQVSGAMDRNSEFGKLSWLLHILRST